MSAPGRPVLGGQGGAATLVPSCPDEGSWASPCEEPTLCGRRSLAGRPALAIGAYIDLFPFLKKCDKKPTLTCGVGLLKELASRMTWASQGSLSPRRGLPRRSAAARGGGTRGQPSQCAAWSAPGSAVVGLDLRGCPSVLGTRGAHTPGWAPANRAPKDTHAVATRAGGEDGEAGHPEPSGGGAAPLLCEFLRSHQDGPRGRTRGHICPDPGSTVIFFPLKELVGARAQPDELLCCRSELSVRLGPGPTHTPRRARVCTRTQAHVMSGHGAERRKALFRAPAPARGVGPPAQGAAALGAGLPWRGRVWAKGRGSGGPVGGGALCRGAGPGAGPVGGGAAWGGGVSGRRGGACWGQRIQPALLLP